MSYDADIFDAVEFGDLLSVQMYWTDAINIDWQDETGTDLLMLACGYGHIEIVHFLLSFNPNLNQKNNFGKTTLQLAQENGYADIINLILEKINYKARE
jgi:ankyrin repeat protein